MEEADVLYRYTMHSQKKNRIAITRKCFSKEWAYAIWYVQYGEGKVGNVQHGEVTTSIGNDVYVGPMTTRSDIYIARRGKYPFRYSLDEPFEEVVYVNERDPNEKGNPDALVFGKIYRPMEFKEAYPKLYKEYLGE